ncbi:hypothetical protein L1887_06705 [Cichorium endivia]|nr:hypothetical protein L1887_06705 [Cichorium endivia]
MFMVDEEESTSKESTTKKQESKGHLLHHWLRLSCRYQQSKAIVKALEGLRKYLEEALSKKMKNFYIYLTEVSTENHTLEKKIVDLVQSKEDMSIDALSKLMTESFVKLLEHVTEIKKHLFTTEVGPLTFKEGNVPSSNDNAIYLGHETKLDDDKSTHITVETEDEMVEGFASTPKATKQPVNKPRKAVQLHQEQQAAEAQAKSHAEAQRTKSQPAYVTSFPPLTDEDVRP